jgi:hypothetical protein
MVVKAEGPSGPAKIHSDDPKHALDLVQYLRTIGKTRRIVLCHATEESGFTLTCATDNAEAARGVGQSTSSPKSSTTRCAP